MEYREFKKTGIKISEISLGCEPLDSAPTEKLDDFTTMIDIAMDAGINYMDFYTGSPDVRDYLGRVLKGRRKKMLIAGHLGAAHIDGAYARIRDMEQMKFFINDLLKRLDTDYVDILMLHFIDEHDDLKNCLEGGMADYALELKKKGVARMIGMSTHVPSIAKKVIETGMLDGLMFSINPLFDLLPGETDLIDLVGKQEFNAKTVEANKEKHELYALCEKEEVGIVVMKTFAAGWLLGEKSPIKMDVNQCISYALSKLGVLSTVCGIRSVQELTQALAYFESSEDERNFASIFSSSFDWDGESLCMYCNHCMPCPEDIDIAGSMRIYDASGIKPEGCTGCGICEQRCPFGVIVTDKFL